MDKYIIIHGDYKITFDFVNYTVSIPAPLPIDVMEEIQKDEEYRFLYEFLVNKYSCSRQLYDADYDKYEQQKAEFERRYGK